MDKEKGGRTGVEDIVNPQNSCVNSDEENFDAEKEISKSIIKYE